MVEQGSPDCPSQTDLDDYNRETDRLDRIIVTSANDLGRVYYQTS